MKSNEKISKNFFCALMLAQLSKWIRLLGYSSILTNVTIANLSLYDNPTECKELKQIINFDGYFLTRSRIFEQKYKKFFKNSKIILINSDKTIDQLTELYKFNIIDFEYNTRQYRCSICNNLIFKVEDKMTIKNKVPTKSFEYYSEFYQCSKENCNKIFWRGTHWAKIDSMIASIKEKVIKLN